MAAVIVINFPWHATRTYQTLKGTSGLYCIAYNNHVSNELKIALFLVYYNQLQTFITFGMYSHIIALNTDTHNFCLLHICNTPTKD